MSSRVPSAMTEDELRAKCNNFAEAVYKTRMALHIGSSKEDREYISPNIDILLLFM